MLQMTCPKCKESIRSALLADLPTVDCGKCSHTVPVENVTVVASGFTMHREDLLKRVFRYQQLLVEVKKEHHLLVSQQNASRESVESVERFLATLEELLAGTRNKFRMIVSEDIPVSLTFGGQTEAGRLVNLSMGGACLTLANAANQPRGGQDIILEFRLPNMPRHLTLGGKVVWIRKTPGSEGGDYGVGIRFHTLEDAAGDNLWQVISAHAAQENKSKVA